MWKVVCGCLLLGLTMQSRAQTAIKCEMGAHSSTYFWPEIYLSKSGALCFDSGSDRNCVRNGGSTQWSAFTIVMIGDESQGRDDTSFRVRNAVVTDERLAYIIEWSRSNDWHVLQRISINRLTGDGVNFFVNGEQGGDSMHCRAVSKKI
jgi:hypothetical protein